MAQLGIAITNAIPSDSVRLTYVIFVTFQPCTHFVGVKLSLPLLVLEGIQDDVRAILVCGWVLVTCSSLLARVREDPSSSIRVVLRRRGKSTVR